MTTIAVIPARAGSTRLLGKNRLRLGGDTLVQRAVRVAARVRGIDEIVVSSDSPEILNDARIEVLDHGSRTPLRTHLRPAELSRADSGIEDLLRHLIGPHARIVLLNPTSPFRTVETVERCLAADGGWGVRTVYESVLPHYAVGGPVSLAAKRPRSQDLEAILVEHGACYVIQSHMVSEGHLTHERGSFIRTDELEAIDIDTPLDWARAQGVQAWLERGKRP